MFHLFLVTPEKIIYDDLIHSIIVPGTIGYFEVLTNHAAIISSLTIGKLIITDKNNVKSLWSISGGLFEFTKNKATLLGDAVELSSAIDIKRAESEIIHSKKVIEEATHNPVELQSAKRELKVAMNRLKIVQEGRKSA